LDYQTKLAYHLWEQSERRAGMADDHWQQAVNERDALERTIASTDDAEVKSRHRQRKLPLF
jgi:hypothetical protein